MKLTKKLRLVILLLFATAAGFFTSCTKNTYDFNKFASNQWDPEFATALVTGTVGINNINLTDANSYLQIYDDSSMSFIFQKSITTFHTSDFIPALTSTPTVFTRSLSPTEQLALTLAPSGATFTTTGIQTINLSTAQANPMNIDTIVLKTGTLILKVQNTFSDSCSITATIPGIKSNGVSISKVIPVAPSSSTTVSFDLSNLVIDMSNGGTTSNYLELDYGISFIKTSPLTTGTVSFTTQVNNPTFKTIYGDVLQQNFFTAKVDSVPLNIFKYAQAAGSLSLSDAVVKLFFRNSFGVPISFVFNQLNGTDANNNKFSLNTAGITPSPFIIDGATQLGVSTHDTLTMNKNNPPSNGALLNIPQFFSKLPISFYPQFSSVSNPGSSSVQHYNFIQDTSSGSIDAQIQIPLNVKLNNYLTKDTFDYNIGSVQNIQSLTLRTYFNNGFPIGINAFLEFKDVNYKTIFTLGSNQLTDSTKQLLAPAIIDPNTGMVISKTATTTDFELDSTAVANLSKVKKVVFTGSVYSAGYGKQYAKIYHNYTIDVKLGAKAKLKN